MGKRNRYRGLKKFAQKLYRMNHGAALKVLNAKLGGFDDVLTGVCSALTCMWLQVIVRTSLRSLELQALDPTLNPASLFLGRSTHEETAGYLTTHDIVDLQRRYKTVWAIKDEDVTRRRARQMQFWRHAFARSGLRLVERHCYSVKSKILRESYLSGVQLQGVDLATQFDHVIRVAKLDAAGPPAGVGVYVSMTLNRPNQLSAGHAVGLYRLGPNANGALYFFDANCGVYCIRHPHYEYDASDPAKFFCDAAKFFAEIERVYRSLGSGDIEVDDFMTVEKAV